MVAVTGALVYFLLPCLFSSSSAVDSYPTAQNVTWTSNNFKTFLSWEPEPSDDYTYTVEFSVAGGDKRRNPHCIRSSATQCDLTTFLSDLHGRYTAEVLSTPPLGVTSDMVEFPYSSAPNFCPYKDTLIGKPTFKVEVSDDKRKTTVYVTDPLTAVYKDGRLLNIRDIFADQLFYRVTYRKNQSTGKKVVNSKSNVLELSDLDRGESYCFNVQAFIPERAADRQLGELSKTQCTEDDNPSIFQVYSVGVIAVAVLLVLLLVGLIVSVTVVCCRRRNKARSKGKEGVPLHHLPI